MINNIKMNIRFKDYQFRRVKAMGKNPVIYLPKTWVGKYVSIIPMPINITDRLIDKCYDSQLGWYELTVESKCIINKTVTEGGKIGRVYVPKEWIGLDCLIIESPKLENF